MKGIFVVGILVFVGLFALVLFPQTESPELPSIFAFPEAPKETTLLFVGDLMFDRHIRNSMEAYGSAHILSDVAQLLSSADLTIGNLEGPITSYPSVSTHTEVGSPANMHFTFAPSIPALLTEYGFDLVSIGNNHILDFGEEGLMQTLAHTRTAGLAVVGNPLEKPPLPLVRMVSGIRVAFIGYNDFFGANALQTQEAIRVSAETADVTVVLAHWGDEYVPEPPERIQGLARSFVESGADLVIGTHPHVVQPYEDYQGARIYYSLGNFVFDQYWMESVRCGQAVHVQMTHLKGETTFAFSETAVGMLLDGSTVWGCR